MIATAGGARKAEICRTLGAELAIDYTSDDFVGAVKGASGGRGADVVFDPVGGDVFDKSTKCIAFEGRIIVIGFTSGRFPEVRANHLLVKNYGVLGLHWGMYNVVDPEAVRAAQKAIYALYEEGKIKPLVSERVPLSDAPAAMQKLAARGSVGKMVMVP